MKKRKFFGSVLKFLFTASFVGAIFSFSNSFATTLSSEEKIGKLEQEIAKRASLLGVIQRQTAKKIDSISQVHDQKRKIREILSGLFSCAANLIESGYGLDSGDYDTVIQGVLYLEMSLEARKKWDLENLKQKVQGREGIPQDLVFLFLNQGESCQDYLATIKKTHFRPSRFPNKELFEKMVTELREDFQIDEAILKMVRYALDPAPLEVSEAIKKYQRKAICIIPKIYSLGVPLMKLYKIGLTCVTPLGRVVEYESSYHLEMVSSFIFQAGLTSTHDYQTIAIPVYELSGEFEKKYFVEERVTLGFSEIDIKSKVKKVEFDEAEFRNRGDEDEKKEMISQSTYQKLLLKSKRAGGAYLGFGVNRLDTTLEERKSIYAPLSEEFSLFTRESGNIPKILGFDEFWWENPYKENFLVEKSSDSLKAEGSNSVVTNFTSETTPFVIKSFPFKNEKFSKVQWEKIARKEKERSQKNQGKNRFRLSEAASRNDINTIAKIISDRPSDIIPLLKGKYLYLITPKVSSHALVLMSKNLNDQNNIYYAKYMAIFVQTYIRHWAHKNPEKICSYLNRLLEEMSEDLKRMPPTPKEAGILLGVVIAGSIKHTYAIQLSDTRRTLIINSVTNLVWATTTFLGALPFLLGNVAALIGGAVSFGVVAAATIWNFAETPRDYSSMIKEIEGRIKMNLLETAEKNISLDEPVFKMLHWINATILVNGQLD